MSSINAVSGSNADLIRLFQQYVQQRLSSSTSSTEATAAGGSAAAASDSGSVSAPSGPPPMDESRQADFIAKIVDAAKASGADATSLSGLKDEIKSAIDGATQNADNSTDPRQAVQQAVDGVLKKHGVDLETFKSELQATMGPRPGGKPPQVPPPAQDAASTNQSSSNSIYSTQTTDASSQLLTSLLSTLDEIA
jgi:hypothetical protein